MSRYEEEFLNRHGEIGVLFILENWERAQGIKSKALASVEDRWMAFLQGTANDNACGAALQSYS